MYFEGCNSSLGCTIVLRGAEMNTLGKLKRIIDFLSYVAYNLKLETSLICDQFALIPQPKKFEPQSQDPIRNFSEIERLENILNLVDNCYAATILSCSP